jgi:hydroxypyruvate reductase
MTLPAEPLRLADLRAVTAALLEAGAPIGELNTVRKHLEVLKGGGLARAAAPASVRALILSDVVGDPLDVIASGPVSPDPTTFEDAMAVLRDRGVWSRVPASVKSHLEAGAAGAIPDTPDAADALFRDVSVSVIGNAARAAEAAAAEAARLGYRATVESVTVTGEAREVGARLGAVAQGLPTGECRILAGETTVTVTGDGRGGRNQEAALSAAEALAGREDALVFSVGTDGVDGPTDAAGAWVTGRTLGRATALGLDPRVALDRNDSYTFFRAMDDLVITGPTGTNVMDLMGILAGLPDGSP